VALLVHADLDLVIDGLPAKLTGSGRVLRLELSEARILRSLLRVSLPRFPIFGSRAPTPAQLPGLLAAQGLTLEITDPSGPLLVLGEGAKDKIYRLPGVGRLEYVALARPGAALRLLFGA
jgi:hypothetical protein